MREDKTVKQPPTSIGGSKATDHKVKKEDSLSGINDALTKSLNKPQASIAINPNILANMNRDVPRKLDMGKSAMNLLSDMDLGSKILTSLVVNGAGEGGDIILTCPTSKIPHTILTSMLEILKSEVEKKYKVADNLNDVFLKSYITEGSWATAYVPEAYIREFTVDEKITKETGSGYRHAYGVESAFTAIQKKGFTNNIFFTALTHGGESKARSDGGLKIDSIDFNKSVKTNKESTEKYIENSDFENIIQDMGSKIESLLSPISENLSTLAVPTIFKDALWDSTIDSIRGGYESAKQTSEVSALPKRRSRLRDIMRSNRGMIVTTGDKTSSSIGRAMSIFLPKQSCIPIHSSTDVSQHIGYIILTEKGAPIDYRTTYGDSHEIAMNVLKNDNIVIKKGATNDFYQNRSLYSGNKIEGMREIYAALIQEKIDKEIKNSRLAGGVNVGIMNHVLNALYQRMLSDELVQLVYIPKELTAWYAFNYKENGTGESILEMLETNISFRLTVLMSRMLVLINNAITVKKITGVIDEREPDPERTRQRMIAEVMRDDISAFPLNSQNLTDITSWMSRFSIIANITNPHLPNTTMSVETSQKNLVMPSDELETELRNSGLRKLGIPPALLSDGADVELATVFKGQNAMLAQTVHSLQKKYSIMIADHYNVIIEADPAIRYKLVEVLKDNMGSKEMKEVVKVLREDHNLSDEDIIEALMIDLSDTLKASLPSIETTNRDELSQKFTTYRDDLTAALDSLFEGEQQPSSIGEPLSSQLTDFKLLLRSKLIKEWMHSNGFLPEIAKALTDASTGGVDIVSSKMDLMTIVVKIIELSKELTPELKKFIEKNGEAGVTPDTTDEANTEDTITEDSGKIDDNVQSV